MSNVITALLSGLGLFFVGVKLIPTHLRQMTGREVRNRVASLVDHPWRGAVVGLVSGAATQSTNVVTFIMTSLQSAGLIDVRRAMPVIIWANVGTSVLVMVATVDIRVAVSMLLAVVGLAYYLDVDRSSRFRHLAGALLGVALLFLGLQLIKGGAAPLQEMESVRSALQRASAWWGALFLVGAVVTAVLQSSGTVSAIAATMTSVGLLSMEQTILIIYGASVGSAVSLWFLSAALHGVGRQLVVLQVLFKSIAALVMLVLLWLELVLELPLVIALVQQMGGNPGVQAAWVFLLFQLVGAAIMTVGFDPVHRLMQRWSPPSKQEALSRPQYLYAQAVDEVTSATALVEREQQRLVQLLPEGLSTAERDAARPVREAADDLLAANHAVTEVIGEFVTTLLDRQPDRDALDRLLSLQARNRLLADLGVGVHQFDRLVSTVSAPDAATLTEALVESLHFVLSTLAQALDEDGADEVALLREMTADRSSLMDGVRKRLLADGQSLSLAAREQLYEATSLFERLIWLVRQYVQLVPAR
jgi:phosphate:Na+ symporter